MPSPLPSVPSASRPRPSRSNVSERSAGADRIWTVQEALNWTKEYLATKGDESPRISAEWLLSHATGMSRIEIYAYFDRPLTPEERTVLRAGVARRAAGEPLQYVAGEVAFRHIVVKVGSGVLIPRPETEVLVGLVLERIAAIETPRVLDIGTGSGCIALSILKEHPGATVLATDLSPEAAAIAQANADRLGFSDRFEVRVGDLSDPVTPEEFGTFDAVVSNPPYVPSAEVDTLALEVIGFEPRLALDGGSDGLDVYRRLLPTVERLLTDRGVLAVELHETNAPQARTLAVELKSYSAVQVLPDLAGRLRFVLAER